MLTATFSDGSTLRFTAIYGLDDDSAMREVCLLEFPDGTMLEATLERAPDERAPNARELARGVFDPASHTIAVDV